MSKMGDMMRADVVKRFGPDAAKVIDYLFDMGTLDSCKARNHMIKVEVTALMLTTEWSERRIQDEVAETFSVCREHVRNLGSISPQG